MATRKTIAEIEMLLAAYEAAQSDKRKAEKLAKDLAAEIKALSLKERVYGSMSFALSNGREILNQPEARRLLTEHGIKIPTTETEPSIVVKRVQQ